MILIYNSDSIATVLSTTGHCTYAVKCERHQLYTEECGMFTNTYTVLIRERSFTYGEYWDH